MAAPINKAKFTQDINAPIKAVYVGGLMFSKDNLSNVISVDIVDNGQPFEVTGTVAGTVIRSDGTTIPVNTGAISGNTVSLTLTEACFDVPGQTVVNIIVTNGDVKCCVLRAVYTVVPTETSSIVDPGDILPSIADLIDDIDAAVASIPADYSGLLASIAGTFSTSKPYVAGEYVWNDGTLYRFTAAHAAGSWTGSDATAVTIGRELADLKSAIADIETIFPSDYIDITPALKKSGYFMSDTGVETASQSCSYKTLAITADLAHKDFKISGSGWYSVNPYVFVGLSGNIIVAHVGTNTQPVQYTDLAFTPNEAGTLYINIYSSQIGKAEYLAIDNSLIKANVLPLDEINSEITSVIDYTEINLGNLIESKLLNGTTGEIANGTNSIQRVSDYIPIVPSTDYLITTQANYDRGMLAWYTSDKIFISGESATTGTSTMTSYLAKRVKSPKNAAYIVIGYIYSNPHPFPALMKGNKAAITKKWEGRKWAVIGDSLSASYTPTAVHYFELIAGTTGIGIANMSYSGNGYAKGDGNFTYQVQNMPTDVDVVTFFGSGNDQASGLDLGIASDVGDTTIAGCINRAIDALYTINPLIPLGIITPTPWKGKMPYNDGWMESYANLIIDICKRRGIPCLDLYHCSGLDTNNATVISMAYSRDNGNATHLNELGHKFITPKIKSFLETLID